MLDLNMMQAIGMTAARQARERAAQEGAAANEIIDMAALLEPWKAGTMENPVEYPQNAVRVHNEMPWRCAIAHTHHGEPGWAPGEGNSMWFPKHGTDRAHALPYVMICAETVYNAGEWMIWIDGLAYKCKLDGTSHGPDVLPDAWEAES